MDSKTEIQKIKSERESKRKKKSTKKQNHRIAVRGARKKVFRDKYFKNNKECRMECHCV